MPDLRDRGADDASYVDTGARDGRVDALASPDAGPEACMTPGNGEIRVMLQLGTGVDLTRAETWVAAMCLTLDGEHAVRVVRADVRGATSVTLAGLGPGRYVVRASTLVVPSAVSAVVDVSPGGTAITPLTIAPGAAPIAQLRAAPDGGVALDGAAMSPDGARPPGFTATTNITRAGRTEPVGSLEVRADPLGRTAFDVTATARSFACATGCVRLGVNSVEVRVARAGEPAAFAVMPMTTGQGATTLLAPGDFVTATRTVQAALSDPSLSFAVGLWGSVSDPDAGVADAGGVRPTPDAGTRD